MASKYPTLAFSARDVQEILEACNQVLSHLSISVQLRPSKSDPLRLCVQAIGFRRAVEIGVPSRQTALRYVASNTQQSLDRVLYDLLWELHQTVEAPPELHGTYTELVPGFRPR